MLVLLAIVTAVGAGQTTDLHALVARAQARMQVTDCEGKACKADPAERYRLAGGDADPAPGPKDRAFAQDGSYCGVVGDKYCPSGRHPVIRSGESPLHTIMGSLP